ncbi:hypothetical protein AAZV13_01G157200 [Glycine max]
MLLSRCVLLFFFRVFFSFSSSIFKYMSQLSVRTKCPIQGNNGLLSLCTTLKGPLSSSGTLCRLPHVLALTLFDTPLLLFSCPFNFYLFLHIVSIDVKSRIIL